MGLPPGRPPLPPGLARTKSVKVSLTEHEYAVLEWAVANGQGESPADVLRRAYLHCAYPAWAKCLEFEAGKRRAEERRAKRRKELDERRRSKGK